MNIIKYPENISKDDFINIYAWSLLECIKVGMQSSYEMVLAPHSDESWYKHFKLNLNNGVRYIVLEDACRIRGYLVWHDHDDEIHIYDLIIHPDFQGDGVTLRHLMEIAAGDIKKTECSKLIAYTNFKNDRMNKLLLRHGFKIRQKRVRGTVYVADLNRFLNKFS